MRIAVLMSIASPWSRQVALRLSECGHQVHVIGFGNGGRDSYLKVTDDFQVADIAAFQRTLAGVHILGAKHPSSAADFSSARKLRAKLNEVNADILLTLYGGSFAALAYLSGFQPYAVFVVGSDVLYGGFLKHMISRIFLARAAAVFSNGAYLAQRTRKLVPGTRVQELYLGTDIKKFSIEEPRPQPITVVCPRGFNEVYNNELVVRALACMPEEFDAFTTVFAAAGPLLNKVRSLADEVLSPERRRSVTFLGGIGRDDLAKLLKRSHVYVSVSRSDGTSLSLMEAMASGVFPVLSDIPQNREWISEQAANGILVPLDDQTALARALARAITDHKLRASAALHNRRLILERADDRKNIAVLAFKLESIVLPSPTTQHALADASR